MKLMDALQIKQAKFEIPDCSRNDLPEFFKEMGYQVGAEIGVFKGRFTAAFCAVGLKMYAIDPWLAYPDFNDRHINMEVVQNEENGYYKIAAWRLKRYRRLCTIVRKMSMDALEDFEDGSLDFVYIDANHHFKYIAADLVEWNKKVRIGGIMSGHDYVNRKDWPCHVKSVVDAYVEAFEIKPLYILGSGERRLGEDRIRSWMWLKE